MKRPTRSKAWDISLAWPRRYSSALLLKSPVDRMHSLSGRGAAVRILDPLRKAPSSVATYISSKTGRYMHAITGRPSSIRAAWRPKNGIPLA